MHRDLKPENIFLGDAPDGGREVKVLDFGIAKLTASDGDAAHTGATTGTGAILGTPYYMAPEQLFGEKDIDHRADLWALGIILYEALSGQRPTSGDNVGQIYKIVMTDAIVPLQERAAHLPEPVTALVGRMLSREQSARPADANEVLSVLSQYTNESFVGIAGPPASLKRESIDTPGERNARSDPAGVDSDTARASTLDAAAALNRSGVEIPAAPEPPGSQGAAVGRRSALGGVSLRGGRRRGHVGGPARGSRRSGGRSFRAEQPAAGCDDARPDRDDSAGPDLHGHGRGTLAIALAERRGHADGPRLDLAAPQGGGRPGRRHRRRGPRPRPLPRRRPPRPPARRPHPARAHGHPGGYQ